MKSLINMTKTTLDTAARGKKHLILRIEGDPVVCERLFEMGFTPNEEIEIQHQLMWNGPLIVSVRSTRVALRISEAQCVQIQPTHS